LGNGKKITIFFKQPKRIGERERDRESRNGKREKKEDRIQKN